MNTRSDIRHGEQLTITVLVTGIEEWESHDHIARKVQCKDIEGEELTLTVFHNNEIADFDWTVGQWYKFVDAKGNIYQGTKQLNPSYDFRAVPLDGAPDEATFDESNSEEPASGPSSSSSETTRGDETTSEVATASEPAPVQFPLERGNYLLHFPMDSLSELTVNEYKLNVPGGIDPSDENLRRGITGFTAKVAAYARYQSGGPVTTNGSLRIYSVNELRGELTVDGYTIQPEHVGAVTLDAQEPSDRYSIKDLIKQDVKAALSGQYDVKAINTIVEQTPHLKAKNGDFTASRKYACQLRVDPDGTVVCGVSVSLELESTFSAAEYVQRGHDVTGVRVSHNTDLYDKDGTGTVEHLLDRGYTDQDDSLGCSLAEFHERHRRVETDVLEDLRASEVVMAWIDYNGFEGSQALELCRVIPTLDELERVDPAFHQRAQKAFRMLPDERFSVAQSFIESIGETPALNLTPVGRVTNDGYTELQANTGRNLRFADGNTASYGKQGLDSYGVYMAPESLDILALYPERFSEEANQFFGRLKRKLSSYGAPVTGFETESYTLGPDFGYTTVGQSGSDADCVVAVVPDKGWAAGQDGIDDPFDDFKKQFGQDKVPSQMVTESSLTEYAYLGNIATGVVAKAGGIPWRVDKIPGGADVFIGLDVTYDPETRQHVGASANIVMADGTILASESVSLQQGETFDVEDVIRILKNLIRVYVKEEGHAPNHVIIHRDGRFFLDVDELVARLNEASDFIPKFDLVEITKGGNPRIGEYNGSSFEVADKGVGFVSKHEEQAFLATTGKPELKPGNRLGTPRPIRITKRHGPTDVETLTKQVYWLSEAHVASISRSTRLPITTHYADLCADHARKGYMINDELVRGVPYV